MESDISVISCTTIEVAKRILDTDGRIHPAAFKQSTMPLQLYDGSIYAGRLDNWQDWFDMTRPHAVVVNQAMTICDIDTLEDLQNHIRFI